jgi:transposase
MLKYKFYRPYNQDRARFRDWLHEGHLAFFVSDVVDSLDLSPIYSSYERESPRGSPPYHPAMMVKLWVYGYCDGERSSHRIEKLTHENAAYRYLAGEQHPDHNSLASFRRRHLEVLSNLFPDVVRLAMEAGLVSLEHVAIDGSKALANASKHKAMSYDRMLQARLRLPGIIEKIEAEMAALSDNNLSNGAQKKTAKLTDQAATPLSEHLQGHNRP